MHGALVGCARPCLPAGSHHMGVNVVSGMECDLITGARCQPQKKKTFVIFVLVASNIAPRLLKAHK